MSRYRLIPTPAQEALLRDHCAHARYVWNHAVEQHAHWHPGRKGAPGYLEQCRQLTAARAEHDWLRAGCQMVQQQALRDFAHAVAAFLDRANPAGRPSWRKAGRDEGFRVKAKLNRGILRSGWGLLVRRLDAKSRESQARFCCTACGYASNADVNAAINIAAGHAVTARGGCRDAGPVNREPHLLASFAGA
jgi:hypothetical protein